MKGIRYKRRDFNHVNLPASAYDIVFFHGSLHHAANPDRLLDEVLKTLKPGGFLYVDEYVGPSRDEWRDEYLRHVRSEYDLLDDNFKLRPLAPPVEPGDPSEMIRSSRILPAIRERFEILHYRPYWGNLLFPLFCVIKGEELLKPEHETVILRWIERERELVSSREFPEPLFAVVLARKK
jgi:SAM-dependent methyltransferase